MKSLLITSLKNEVNLVKASHLINSLLKESPHTEVSLLTFKDLEEVAKTVKGLKNIFCLDRHKIEHLKSGALYSDAFALNALAENLNGVLQIEWDHFVNFSNDKISAYLAPLLRTNSVVGSSVSIFGSANTSDQWASYRNFYCPVAPSTAINPVSCLHHSLNIPYAREGERIRLNQDFSLIANQNFARIRASKSSEADAVIVGVNLSPSDSGASFSKACLQEIIETLETSVEYKAVLLIRGSDEEKAMVNELNRVFNNSLISINMDVSAMPSVLANLDCMITLPNFTGAMADALDTKIIEVAPAGAAGVAMNDGNFLVREHSRAHTADDILFILNQENETILPINSKNSENKVYALVNDNYGTFTTLIRGAIDLNEELEYHVSRCFHYSLMGYPINVDLIANLRTRTSKEALAKFASQTNEEMTEVVRTLLAALRSLKNINSSGKNASKFIQYLDQLILLGKKKSPAQAAISLFEAAVENISSQNTEENMREIEKSLFNLKADLQGLTKILKQLLSDEDIKQTNVQKEA